ncbi:GGDEF domain-containing protein [Shewanella halifaxensis]|uniref:GGDEF domain-containing protein n=1 Tax=Shewanella halifaxensis TaxID=271098 RepID=UPI000D599103|nr:GGDEF domain-containing protein [Shewanella halifaxensis]
MDNIELNDTAQLRRAVLIGMCTLLGGLSLLLALINLVISPKWTLLGYVELFYALFSFSLAWQAYKHRHKFWQVNLYLYVLTAIVIYAVTLSETINSIVCWALILPTVFYLLLGKKLANIPTVILLTATTSTIINKYGLVLNPLFVNFVFSYLLVWVISHIYESNRAASEQKLQKLALQDPLTASFNRLALTRYFEQLHSPQTFKHLGAEQHLLILDIDFFKQVNDEFGHEAGDLVLQECANIISRIAGNQRTFRIGGEEFCVVIENKLKDEALSIAESIRTQVAQHQFNITQQKEINITVSIGLTQYQSGMALSNVLRQADQRLYRAKNAGRDQVIFDSEPLVSSA